MLPVLLALCGVLALLFAINGFRQDRHAPTSFGAAPAATVRTPHPANRVATEATSPSPSPHHSVGPSPHPSASAAGAAPGLILLPPARLSLPTLGVHAQVRDVVTVKGVLGVPDDIADVGWWTGSAPPGSPVGSTVIDGHVDSAASGAGALFRLGEVHLGDPVTLADTAGNVSTYRVSARHVYVKHQGLPADLFDSGGPPRLILITCGGRFDSATRSYQDNIVVLAARLS